MVKNEYVEHLRALLYTPSKASWRRLCSLFDVWMASSDKANVQTGLRYATEHLVSWPVDFDNFLGGVLVHSSRPAPPHWIQWTLEGRKLPIWPLVRGFHFEGGAAYRASMLRLLCSPIVSQLTHLSLPKAELDAGALEQVVTSDCCEKMTHLYLRENPIRKAAPFSEALKRQLKVLDITDCGFTPNEVLSLLDSPDWENLEALYLGFSSLDPRVFELLAFAERLPRLRFLKLGQFPGKELSYEWVESIEKMLFDVLMQGALHMRKAVLCAMLSDKHTDTLKKVNHLLGIGVFEGLGKVGLVEELCRHWPWEEMHLNMLGWSILISQRH